jgi:peptidoglycan/LPS O-acetylase OafA/YrhL
MSKENNYQSGRLMELEGLRGIASIIVVIFHALVIFYPVMFYGITSGWSPVQHIWFENNLFGGILSAFSSGAFAVGIFFVLSGFVLTIGYFQTNDDSIIRKMAAKRYIRLMFPALASVLIVWLIMTLGFASGKEQAELITQAGSSSSLWNFKPDILLALNQGVWQIFSSIIGQDMYNPALWTMLYEFSGSFLAFATVLLFGRAKHRWLVYGLLFIVLYDTWYVGFISGMMMADIYVHKINVFKSLIAQIVA